jgi:hypothetical protein
MDLGDGTPLTTRTQNCGPCCEVLSTLDMKAKFQILIGLVTAKVSLSSVTDYPHCSRLKRLILFTGSTIWQEYTGINNFWGYNEKSEWYTEPQV